jgi:hypothetical protein
MNSQLLLPNVTDISNQPHTTVNPIPFSRARMLRLPISIKALTIDESFLQTTLGKIVTKTGEWLIKNGETKDPNLPAFYDKLNKALEDGTCEGEANTMLISEMSDNDFEELELHNIAVFLQTHIHLVVKLLTINNVFLKTFSTFISERKMLTSLATPDIHLLLDLLTQKEVRENRKFNEFIKVLDRIISAQKSLFHSSNIESIDDGNKFDCLATDCKDKVSKYLNKSFNIRDKTHFLISFGYKSHSERHCIMIGLKTHTVYDSMFGYYSFQSQSDLIKDVVEYITDKDIKDLKFSHIFAKLKTSPPRIILSSELTHISLFMNAKEQFEQGYCNYGLKELCKRYVVQEFKDLSTYLNQDSAVKDLALILKTQLLLDFEYFDSVTLQSLIIIFKKFAQRLRSILKHVNKTLRMEL